MRHQLAQGHGVNSEPEGMTYSVILLAGPQTQLLRTIEADTTEEAWEQARRLFLMDDVAIVANDD